MQKHILPGMLCLRPPCSFSSPRHFRNCSQCRANSCEDVITSNYSKFIAEPRNASLGPKSTLFCDGAILFSRSWQISLAIWNPLNRWIDWIAFAGWWFSTHAKKMRDVGSSQHPSRDRQRFACQAAVSGVSRLGNLRCRIGRHIAHHHREQVGGANAAGWLTLLQQVLQTAVLSHKSFLKWPGNKSKKPLHCKLVFFP